MQHSRLFLACDIDDDVIHRLESLIGTLAPLLPDVRWVRREAIHLTLKYFGDQPLDRVRDIDRAVASAGIGGKVSSFRLEGVGMFPHMHRPRVLWAGISDGSAEVTTLANALSESCEAEGFRGENRGYVPHITLGRFKKRTDAPEYVYEDIVERFSATVFGTVCPEELVLYSSELTPHGPVYTRMASWPLA